MLPQAGAHALEFMRALQVAAAIVVTCASQAAQPRRIRGNIRRDELFGRIGRGAGAPEGHAVFGKHDLKWLLRSGSPQFARDRDPARYAPGTVSSFRWRGR